MRVFRHLTNIGPLHPTRRLIGLTAVSDCSMVPRMAQETRLTRAYWTATTIVTAAAVAGYYVYSSIQPACGAPGNTALGRSNHWVPWAILSGLLTVVLLVGAVARRRPATILRGVLAAGLLAVLAGAGVAFYFFTAGHCYY